MKEHEIRPEKLIKKYLELSMQDAKKFFADAVRVDVDCVGCGSTQFIHQFDKDGFSYVLCEDCASLYQSPRPSIDDFKNFYTESESSRFCADVFFPAVAEVRREKIFRPRVKRLAALCAEKGVLINNLIDVGAGYGLFLDEWKCQFPNLQLTAVEPSVSMANKCREKGFNVLEDIVENVTINESSFDLVTCFEVLEHVYEPFNFIQALKKFVQPGGYVAISTLSIDGFDLQLLWDKSSQITPPHHINFLSIQGFEKLFERAGFDDIDVFTPGELDVDIIINARKNDPSLLRDNRFLQNLISDEKSAIAFQKFLTEQRLSSHVWVLARKPVAKLK